MTPVSRSIARSNRRQLGQVTILELHPDAVRVLGGDFDLQETVHVDVVGHHHAVDDRRQLGGLTGRARGLGAAPIVRGYGAGAVIGFVARDGVDPAARRRRTVAIVCRGRLRRAAARVIFLARQELGRQGGRPGAYPLQLLTSRQHA